MAEKKKVGAGNPTYDKIYTLAPGAIGNILRLYSSGGSLSYYHYDAMGNLVFVADFDGTPAYSFDQEAYGNVKSGSQSGYHLSTKEYDSHPELYYFFQRWYDPLVGRFLSKAPYPVFIEHQYTFVSNNPLNFIDPFGTIGDVEIGLGLLCVMGCHYLFGWNFYLEALCVSACGWLLLNRDRVLESLQCGNSDINPYARVPGDGPGYVPPMFSGDPPQWFPVPENRRIK